MENILGYPDYKINKVIETDDSYTVEAQVLPTLDKCENCGSENIVNFGWATESLADKPIKGKKTTIILSRRRQRCNNCNKTFSITPPYKYGTRQLTENLADYIGWACINKGFAQVAEEVGVTKNTVRDVFTEFCAHQDDLLTKNLISGLNHFRTPQSLGVESVLAVKPSTLISNVANQSILNLIPNQEDSELENYLLKKINLDKVKFVVMSLSDSYRETIKRVLPQAIIIVNKKHVLTIVDDSLERVRVANRVSRSNKELVQLRGDSEVLNKRYNDLSIEDKTLLLEWNKSFPSIYQAYLLKESFYVIWEKKNKDEAIAAYTEWLEFITPNLSSYFEPLVVVMANWKTELFSSIEYPQHPRYFRMIDGVVNKIDSLERGGSFLVVWAALMLKKESSTYGINGKEFASE